MPFGLISSGIGAGTSLISGITGGKAAKAAAKTQEANAQQVAGLASTAAGNASTGATNAANTANQGINSAAGNAISGVNGATGNANGLLSQIYNSESSNLSPYLQAGQQGATSLASALAPGGSLAGQFTAPDPNSVSSTPEYQFQLQQGLQALQRSSAATGSLQGGGLAKSLDQYSQGLASTSYQNAYNNSLNTFQTNHQNTLQGLQALTGLGTTATGQLNNAAQNYGNQASGNLYNSGIYNSNLGYSAANTQGSNLISAAQYAGNAGLQGAQVAGNALTGGANATAAGQIGQANAYSSALGGVANAANGAAAYNSYGPGSAYYQGIVNRGSAIPTSYGTSDLNAANQYGG